jgi:hypothetical protein
MYPIDVSLDASLAGASPTGASVVASPWHVPHLVK